MKKERRLRDIDWTPLDELLVKVRRIMHDNPGLTYKDFKVDTYEDDYGDTRYPCLIYETEETGVEKTLRLEQEAKVKVQRDEWDRKKFEELKKKFS